MLQIEIQHGSRDNYLTSLSEIDKLALWKLILTSGKILTIKQEYITAKKYLNRH